MQKLLLLGGSEQQVVAIQTAKRLGCETILCDYLPDNPGQYVADRFYQVSTTDRDAVLEIARREKIDGVMTYASDPAAPTAAYVAEALGLPGNPCRAVDILSNKEMFRAFLSENGFCTPRAVSGASYEEIKQKLAALRYPLLIKPVDSSGSKGITVLENETGLREAVAAALSYSRRKVVIAEEFVSCHGYQVAGDAFCAGGRLVFACLGDDHFDAEKGALTPVAASFPCTQTASAQQKVRDTLARLFTLLGIRQGAFNLDIRVDDEENVYLMEVGARNGGNYIPQVIEYMTGVDMVEATVLAALGRDCGALEGCDAVQPGRFYAYYAVHSPKSAVYRGMRIAPDFAGECVETHLTVKPGDAVKPYHGSNCTMGILILRFQGVEQMLDSIRRPHWLVLELTDEAN